MNSSPPKVSARFALDLLDELVTTTPARAMNEHEYKTLVDYVMIQHNREKESNLVDNVFWPVPINFQHDCVTNQERVEAMFTLICTLDQTMKVQEKMIKLQEKKECELKKCIGYKDAELLRLRIIIKNKKPRSKCWRRVVARPAVAVGPNGVWTRSMARERAEVPCA